MIVSMDLWLHIDIFDGVYNMLPIILFVLTGTTFFGSYVALNILIKITVTDTKKQYKLSV